MTTPYQKCVQYVNESLLKSGGCAAHLLTYLLLVWAFSSCTLIFSLLLPIGDIASRP